MFPKSQLIALNPLLYFTKLAMTENLMVKLGSTKLLTPLTGFLTIMPEHHAKKRETQQ